MKKAAPHTSSAARRKAQFTTALQVAGIAAGVTLLALAVEILRGLTL